MSVCIFLASDCNMPEVAPPKEYPVHIDVDNGTMYDGDADDNFYLRNFENVADYTEKKYGVCLEWVYYTKGRAEKILNYINDVLKAVDSVEIWLVWLRDYYEFDERPVIKKKTLAFKDLSPEHIKELEMAEIWNNEDKERPTFYCLTVTKN